jgi:hypothetical protein
LALDAGPVKVSSVVALEPNSSAALIPLADGALLFDGHGQVVRVQAGERGHTLWSVSLLKPPVEARGNGVSLAEGGFLVAGRDVKGPIAVATKLPRRRNVGLASAFARLCRSDTCGGVAGWWRGGCFPKHGR